MEEFPKHFVAARVKTDIESRRTDRVNDNLKTLRKCIVNACKSSESMFIRVRFKFTVDADKEDRLMLYRQIKDELMARNFTVQGLFCGRVLHLLLCPGGVANGKETHVWHAAGKRFAREVQLERSQYIKTHAEDDTVSLLTEVPSVEALDSTEG